MAGIPAADGSGGMSKSAPIYAALKLRFAAPEWALMFEVANGTGSHIRRYADAVAMNLFPSRGLELHGVEIKVSRGDWQRELKNPAKAETIFQYCDRWWIAAPEGIVAQAELPPTWGLLELKGDKLRQIIAAPRLEPKPLTRPFIAAMMRRSAEADHGIIDSLVSTRVQELRAQDERQMEDCIKSRTREMREKVERIEQIEAAAGISLTDWHASAEIGHIIKAVQASGLTKAWHGLQGLADSLKRHGENVQREIDAFEATVPVEKERAA
jgi:hypothetical protein